MLLEPLVSVIETIKDRIVTHGGVLRQNETRTRTALIDPLMQVLGWDTADPALVIPEYRVDVGWADYALQGAGNKPTAVIEAKRLGAIVENHLEQAVGYCIQQGIAYAGVTDGSHWQLYRTFEPVPLADKLVLDVSIANTPAHEAALKLLLLWRPNLTSGQPVAANAPLFAMQPTTILSQEGNLKPPLEPAPTSGDWISLTKVEAKSGERPNAVRFPDREAYAVQYWSQVLENVTEWLVTRERLNGEDCPIPGLRFINSTPAGPKGGRYKQYKQVRDNLYLNVSLRNSSIAIDRISKLLSHCGVSPETVELRFG